MNDKINSLFIKQAAILEAIQEHGLIQSSTLKRQFMGISERTLRYHLKRLQDQGLIKKRGTTKGVWYEAVNGSELKGVEASIV